MVWAANQGPIRKNGDTRTKVRFAWFPHRIGDVYVWLAQYETLEAWQVTAVPVIIEAQGKVFEIGKWVKVSEKLVKWIRA